MSIPRTTGQVPAYYVHKSTGRPSSDTNSFTSRYLDVASSPLYPFGYGLTYTTFSYSNLSVAEPALSLNDTLKAHVTIKNTGSRPGDEVVQLYVQDEFGSVTRPVRELKAFRTVHLNPDPSATVALSVPVADLAFTGLDMQRRVEPGTFNVFVGPDAVSGLQAPITVEATLTSQGER